MVNRCAACRVMTLQECSRCQEKCCDRHIYHAGELEVCTQCCDEMKVSRDRELGLVDHVAAIVFAGLCVWTLHQDQDFRNYCTALGGVKPLVCFNFIDGFVPHVLLLAVYFIVTRLFDGSFGPHGSKFRKAELAKWELKKAELKASLWRRVGARAPETPSCPARPLPCADGTGSPAPPAETGQSEHSRSGTGEAL